MAGIDSRLTITGLSDVEIDAWIEFLHKAFLNVGLSLGIARTKEDGDTFEYRYCLGGSRYTFVKGVPQVLKYALAFAKSLAMLMHTTPDKYITAILEPIFNDCQAGGTDEDMLKQILGTSREDASSIASQDPAEDADPQGTLSEVHGVLDFEELDSSYAFAWLGCLINAFEGVGVDFSINDSRKEDGSWFTEYRIKGQPGLIVERFRLFHVIMTCFSNAFHVIDNKTSRAYSQSIVKPILASCLEMYPELSKQKIYYEPDYTTSPTWLKDFCAWGQ